MFGKSEGLLKKWRRKVRVVCDPLLKIIWNENEPSEVEHWEMSFSWDDQKAMTHYCWLNARANFSTDFIVHLQRSPQRKVNLLRNLDSDLERSLQILLSRCCELGYRLSTANNKKLPSYSELRSHAEPRINQLYYYFRAIKLSLKKLPRKCVNSVSSVNEPRATLLEKCPNPVPSGSAEGVRTQCSGRNRQIVYMKLWNSPERWFNSHNRLK